MFQRFTISRKITLLAAVQLLSIILLIFFFLWSKWGEVEVAGTMRLNALLVKSASGLISELQTERGQTNLFLNGALGAKDIENIRAQTDDAVVSFSRALAEARISKDAKDGAKDLASRIQQLRENVNRKIPMGQSFAHYSELVETVMATLNASVKAKTTKGLGKRMVNVALFEKSKETAGRLRGLTSGLLAANRPLTGEELKSLMSYHTGIYVTLESTTLTVSEETDREISALMKSPSWKAIADDFEIVVKNAERGNFGIDPIEFYKNATKQVEDINTLAGKEILFIENMAGKIEKDVTDNIRNILVLLALFLTAVIVASFYIQRGITRPITILAAELFQAAEQVAAASGQVASASKMLAEGASQQAAAIEETSSSLEEMSSMTKQNAEGAGDANRLIKESHGTISNANEAMRQLSDSMEEISRVSAEASTIIKSIDEIAFQTNLLALNAAVEAARAGEVGAGFAVVADEVRNLALRAAEAARNTGSLMEGIVTRVNGGVTLAVEARSAFDEVTGSSEKVVGLVERIATASDEQAQGVAELNKAVAEMDGITQQNAATAEESAAASQEMSAQAKHMEGFVTELLALVTRKKDGAKAEENRRELPGAGIPNSIDKRPRLLNG